MTKPQASNLLPLRGGSFGAWTVELFCSLVFGSWSLSCQAATDPLFTAGVRAYHGGNYAAAAKCFGESAALHPAPGTLQNLGLTEWQGGQVGYAVLAWERALWLDPFNQSAHANLRYARKAAQIEAPELAWYEVVSNWLPADWWAWIAGLSFWLAVAVTMLPGILRRPKAGWHQALAALSLTVFLLSLPAIAGVRTRSSIGFVVQKNTPLRLTPTREAQVLTRLPAGEPARWQQRRGSFVLLRTNRAVGWVEQDEFGLICPTRQREEGTRL